VCGLCAAAAVVLRPGHALWLGGQGAAAAPRQRHVCRQQVSDAGTGFAAEVARRPPGGDLDERQREAHDAALRGESVFVTGGAGVGKSTVLLRIIESLRGKLGDADGSKVAVAAATGRAAIVVGGHTLHHLAGIGVPRYVSDFWKMSSRKEFWEGLDVLVIDEISMFSGEFLDNMDRHLRRIRKSDEPFGGLQLVLSGDPYQLVPIEPSFGDIRGLDAKALAEERPRAVLLGSKRKDEQELFLNRGMFFHSDAFWRRGFRTVELRTNHRQESAEYYEALEALRSGGDELQMNSAIVFFNARVRPLTEDDSALQMVATIATMRDINADRLGRLQGESRTFQANDSVMFEDDFDESPLRKALYDDPEKALWDSQFFEDLSNGCPALRDLELKVGARVMLVANLLSVHERLVNGQAGEVTGISRPGEESWVDVNFDDVGPQRIHPIDFESTIPGLGSCFRRQVPLQLAWAITHHRSQGQTLSKVRVDPYAFTDGLLYVALSRCRTIEGLELTEEILPDYAIVNPDATNFMTYHEDPSAQEKLGTWQQQPVPDSLWEAMGGAAAREE